MSGLAKTLLILGGVVTTASVSFIAGMSFAKTAFSLQEKLTENNEFIQKMDESLARMEKMSKEIDAIYKEATGESG